MSCCVTSCGAGALQRQNRSQRSLSWDRRTVCLRESQQMRRDTTLSWMALESSQRHLEAATTMLWSTCSAYRTMQPSTPSWKSWRDRRQRLKMRVLLMALQQVAGTDTRLLEGLSSRRISRRRLCRCVHMPNSRFLSLAAITKRRKRFPTH